ncbi:MAG: NAD(P)-dependent oxidoreductase [Acidobacteria bacterium]|nr:NAD(P)-dependent oxidoreductase [Acidobacteriota bacterium]
MRIAFIGLGVMGGPMAGHLQRAGHDVCVFNRTASRADAWVAEYGGSAAATPREAAAGAAIVCACVGADHDVRAVTIGEDGAFHGMSPDAVFVDHTTASAAVARELHAAARDRGLHFVDAPVSGGQAGAQKGQLSVMCGGDAEPYARVEPVLKAYGRMVARIGESGAGQLCKMCNQLCIAGLVQGLAEALHFAGRADLDIEAVMSVISKGAAQSWQMENRWKTMVAGEFDFGFAVDWMRKDLGIVLDEARRNGSRLPVAALVDQFYAQVQARGGSRWDTSSLIALLDKPTAGS